MQQTVFYPTVWRVEPEISNNHMLTSHEIFAFMPALLGQAILDDIFKSDKSTYRAALNAVAESRKVRPVFLERQPRTRRQTERRHGNGTHQHPTGDDTRFGRRRYCRD
jgi:hypothetical protein